MRYWSFKKGDKVRWLAAVWSATFGRVRGQSQKIIELKLVPLAWEVGVDGLGTRGCACRVPRRQLGRGSLAVARQRGGRGLLALRRFSCLDGGGARRAAARAVRSQEVVPGKRRARAEVTSPMPTWSSVVAAGRFGRTWEVRISFTLRRPDLALRSPSRRQNGEAQVQRTEHHQPLQGQHKPWYRRRGSRRVELGGSLVGRAPRRSRGRRSLGGRELGVASSRVAFGGKKGERGFFSRRHWGGLTSCTPELRARCQAPGLKTGKVNTWAWQPWGISSCEMQRLGSPESERAGILTSSCVPLRISLSPNVLQTCMIGS